MQRVPLQREGGGGPGQLREESEFSFVQSFLPLALFQRGAGGGGSLTRFIVREWFHRHTRTDAYYTHIHGTYPDSNSFIVHHTTRNHTRGREARLSGRMRTDQAGIFGCYFVLRKGS